MRRRRPRGSLACDQIRRVDALADCPYARRMTNTMPSGTVLLSLPVLAMLTGAALAQQQRTFYDASGKVFGRSANDSQGTRTIYDSRGRVISRETTSANTTTVYDARGRNVGRTTNR